MSNHPALNAAIIITAIIIFIAVVGYQIWYTRRLKTPRGAGKEAGIAIATEEQNKSGH